MLCAQDGRRLDRQAGLARAARAGQRDETAGADRRSQLAQLGVAADEPGQLGAQVPGWRRRRGRRPRCRAAWGAGRGKRGILGQDSGLEVPQGRAGVDAQVADQAITDFCVGAQGFGLPSGPVQGEDAQLPQALAQRVLPAQRLQFAGEFPVTAQHQVSSGPDLGRDQRQLVQVGSLAVGEAGAGELGQRLTTPQAERFAQRG